jgi:DNA-binding MarR family transcriptional regulator
MDIPTNAETARMIRQGLTRLMRRMRSERAGEPLISSKLTALGWLLREGPMTPTNLAMLERIRPQSLTRTLTSLEADGLVRRQAGTDDRRQSFVAITEQGYLALSDDMQQRDAWLAAAMTQILSPTERELLRLAAQLMDRLATAEVMPHAKPWEEP